VSCRYLRTQRVGKNTVVCPRVQKMRSTGILQRLEYIWIRREKLVNINLPQSPQVTLDHIGGLLVMYFGLMLISLLVLAFETSYFRYTRPGKLIVCTK
jgi:hypothetical protein